jgi:hypothetical protein
MTNYATAWYPNFAGKLRFLLALDLLYALGAIELESGLVARRTA